MLKEKLQKKFIKFGEDELLGIRDEEGKLWLGIKKACIDIGINEGQARRQVENIMKDVVLNSRCRKFAIVQNEGNREVKREVVALHEDVVTLWLAKIALTPTMQKENPKAVEKLVKYQLGCAKVLHEAFFETEEQKQQTFDDLGLKGDIKDLKTEVTGLANELKGTTNKLETLIDNSTINSRQASKLLIHAKDRVNCLLGGANSKEYKKNSRTYFKNLWLELCECFETNTYKDLNPLNFNDAVTFVSGWSYR